MSGKVFRFAPSPTGALHIGHAYSALLNQDAARKAGGRLLLRIENVDLARCAPENEAGILRDLEWLGIGWEEPVRRQSEHFDDYDAALTRLIDMEAVYPAFMSRSELRHAITAVEVTGKTWPRDPDGVPLYPTDDRLRGPAERQRRIAAGEPFALRLDIARAVVLAGGAPGWTETGSGPDGETGTVSFDPERWGDVIVARKEFPASYMLAVVVDDALQRITTVIRGLDLFYTTSVQRLLQVLLCLPAPIYRHHALILGTDGRKLSKSEGAKSLASLREAGVSAEEVRTMALKAANTVS